jgi:hypothetical protein
MKNITKSLIGLFAVFAFSCTPSDIEDRPVVETTDTPVLTAPASGAIYVLKGADAALQAERFTWDAANFDTAEVTYTVEVDTKTGNFTGTSIKNFGSVVAETQLSVSVLKMDEVALSLGAIPFTATEFVVRIKAVAGTSTLYSNIIEIVINPYLFPARLWMPGGYQASSGYGATDWTPANAPQLASSGANKPDLEGYVYIGNSSNFKLTVDATWDKPQYGLGDSAGTIKLNGGDIPTPATVGYYLLKVNSEKLTYNFTAAAWGIVGGATPGGWDNSTNMTYNKTTKVWNIANVVLTSGEWKFRANNGWDINLGALKTAPDGMNLEYGGDNIAVQAGTYDITLDLSNPRVYKYTIIKK